ncbi:MAG: hypothetical protein HY868_11470 [Chloroflexi bacterium]|nr:hypothetical protein [Chloroflexota bacterium]
MDQQVWRAALAYYQAWNEEKFVTQVLQRGRYTTDEKWQMYQDLYEQAMRIKSRSSLTELLHHAQELEEYYTQIQKFEKRRA